jgi:hypothetical protein
MRRYDFRVAVLSLLTPCIQSLNDSVGFNGRPSTPVRIVRPPSTPSVSDFIETTQRNFVCSRAKFDLLFDVSQSICTSCTEPSHFSKIVGITEHRHVIEVTFCCELGRHRRIWTSSELHADKRSFRINDDFALSWLSCGGEGRMYQSFFEAVSCGKVSRNNWDETIAAALPLIDAMAELYVYVPNIVMANDEAKRLRCGCKIGMDCQHNRSQRKSCKRFKSAAPLATTTVMNHTSKETSGDVLAQIIVDNNTLVNFGRGENQSKDKLGSDLASRFVAEVLEKIDLCVSDQSGACQKSYLDHIISNEKHSSAKVAYDPWHMEKSMRKELNDIIDARRVKNPTEKKQIKDGKRTVLLFPEFAQLSITADSILRWVRTLRKEFQSVDDHEAEDVEFHWRSSYDWMINRAEERGVHLSTEFKERYEVMLEDLLPSVLASRYSVFTSEEESFHNLGRVYWRKGMAYSLPNYRARRNLVALHWQENHRKKENTYQFRQLLLQLFQYDRGQVVIVEAENAKSLLLPPSWYLPLLPRLRPVLSWHNRRRKVT